MLALFIWEEMLQPIIAFHQDEDHHWFADLACGHTQHVRHDPPWQSRLWTQTEQGRSAMIGRSLNCKKCDEENSVARE